MTTLPFWTRPFRVLRQEIRIYRFGNATHGKAVPGQPKVYNVVLFSAAFAVCLAASLAFSTVAAMVGVAVPWWHTPWNVAVPLGSVMLATTRVADGKLAHQYALGKLRYRLRLAVVTDYRRVRPPRTVRDTADVWRPHE